MALSNLTTPPPLSPWRTTHMLVQTTNETPSTNMHFYSYGNKLIICSILDPASQKPCTDPSAYVNKIITTIMPPTYSTGAPPSHCHSANETPPCLHTFPSPPSFSHLNQIMNHDLTPWRNGKRLYPDAKNHGKSHGPLNNMERTSTAGFASQT
jgi:hypothetical protein